MRDEIHRQRAPEGAHSCFDQIATFAMHPTPTSISASLRTPPPRIYWAAWALAGAYNFLRAIFGLPVYENLVFNAGHFGLWALLGLLAMPVMRRYPLRMHWRSWLFHLLLGALLTQIDITLGHWLYAALTPAYQGASAYELMVIAFRSCFHIGLLTYFGFVGIVQGSDAIKLARMREMQIAEHKTACVRAQLQSLKLQLQPHFLFNTMHAIGSLMHYDVNTADRMLNRLSDMLRTSLRECENSVVTLKQEMSFIEAYLEIEKIRFEHRLQVEWAIPDYFHDESIPPFILQPLVENAIKYGVAPRAEGGRIVIRAYAEGASLMLEVADDAPPQAVQQKGFGIGLSNTRSRLEALYGAGQDLALVRSAHGTIARITIPLRAPLLAAA